MQFISLINFYSFSLKMLPLICFYHYKKKVCLKNMSQLYSTCTWLTYNLIDLTWSARLPHLLPSNNFKFPYYYQAIIMLSNLSPSLCQVLSFYTKREPFLHFGNRWLRARGSHSKTKSKMYLLNIFFQFRLDKKKKK